MVAPEHCSGFMSFLSGKGFTDGRAVFECKAKVDGADWTWYRIAFRTVTDQDGRVVRVLARLENINNDVLIRDAAIQKATTDGLTGLLNRDTFFGTVYSLLSESKDTTFALILFDIDNFKAVNDTFGHPAGDDALRTVADVLNRVFTPEDVIGRFGGDEFLVFMPAANRGIVLHRLEQVRQFLRQGGVRYLRPLTCSFGVVVSSDTKQSAKALLDMADKAMYRRKQSGKDGIMFWNDMQ